MVAIERFEQPPPDFEKVIEPIPELGDDAIDQAGQEQGQAILASIVDQFYQKTRGKTVSDDERRLAFREIIETLQKEEQKALLELLEQEA